MFSPAAVLRDASPALPATIVLGGRPAIGRAAGKSSPFATELKRAISDISASEQRSEASTAPAATAARTIDAKEAAKIKSTAQDFESLLVYQLLKQMWDTIPRSGLFDNGLAGQFFREMWLEELSKKVSVEGPGLGVARVVERELTDIAQRTVKPEDLK
jgi:flagellar protein FlgJ